MIWYNKETRNPNGKFFGVRSVTKDDWDNPRDNFTTVAPPVECIDNDIVCDWFEIANTWVVDELALWEFNMSASDETMPRAIEDIWDAIGIINATAKVKAKYDIKKALRDAKPEQEL